MHSLSGIPKMPRGFEPLQDFLQKPVNSFHNVIGIVTDLIPASKSQGSDFQLTFNLQDESCFPSAIRVKFFASEKTRLPPVRQIGDVVVLHRVKKSEFRCAPLAISNKDTAFVVFDGSRFCPADRKKMSVNDFISMPASNSGNTSGPSSEERRWASHLQQKLGPLQNAPSNNEQALKATKLTQAAAASYLSRVSKPQKKTAIIADICENLFCNLTVEVLKKYFAPQGYVELYVTDYSFNKGLSDHQTQSKALCKLFTPVWPSEQQKRTLKVELHPPHSFWTMQNVAETDIIDLLNVRIKWSRSGSELEGNVWGDRMRPDQVNVLHPSKTSPSAKNLIERRNQLFKSLGAPRGACTGNPQVFHVGSDYTAIANFDNGINKAANDRDIDRDGSDNNDRTNKKQKRKKKQKRREEKTKVQKQDADGTDNFPEDGKRSSKDRPILCTAARRVGLSENVKIDYTGIPCSDYYEIPFNPHRKITLPRSDQSFMMEFVNCKHHVYLRVVDFYPHDLRDFVEKKPGDSSHDSLEPRWNFWLVVEPGDPAETERRPFVVQVYGKEAQKLLDIFPEDLRTDARTLHEAREKLFLLWGDLEEQKRDYLQRHPEVRPDKTFSALRHGIRPQNCPFECLLLEMGVPNEDIEEGPGGAGGFKRIWRLFGTKIR